MANKVIFSNLGSSPKDKIVNIGLILIIVVAVILIYNFWLSPIFKNLFSKAKQTNALNKEIAEGGSLTYKENDYENFANQLYTAMKGAGTTTSVVYSVFRQMQTRGDVLKLISKFGIRDGEDLATWMRGEWLLSIKEINTILATKGINYAF